MNKDLSHSPVGIGTLSANMRVTVDALKVVTDAVSTLRKAQEHMPSIAKRADRMYPRS